MTIVSGSDSGRSSQDDSAELIIGPGLLSSEFDSVIPWVC